MAAKKKTPVKKSTPDPKVEVAYAVLVVESSQDDNKYGSFNVFPKLDDAVEYIQEGLEDTTSVEEIARTKKEYRIVEITEIKYDIIPKQAARIVLT